MCLAARALYNCKRRANCVCLSPMRTREIPSELSLLNLIMKKYLFVPSRIITAGVTLPEYTMTQLSSNKKSLHINGTCKISVANIFDQMQFEKRG